MQNKEPTIDDFYNKYTLIDNPIEPNAGYEGKMFETYGPEIDYVIRKNKENYKKIWTIIDGEGNDLWIIAGYHWVNRLGYLISEQEWENEDEQYKD